MERKQILLVTDLVGYGNVSFTVMLPILSYMGHYTYHIPTALVSNPFEYGKINMLDTTEYIKGVFPVWKQLQFHFDAIATGYIPSEQEAQVISSFCLEQAKNGTKVFVDPVMGDEGCLYNGLTSATIQCMREMIAVADLIYPNYTEACYLTNTAYRQEGCSYKEACTLIDELRKLGPKSVLITSIPVDGQPSVAGYNHLTGHHFLLPYTEIPVHFPGTGDIFSAVLIGYLMKGEPLKQSTRKAMDAVYNIIDANKDNQDKFRGLPLDTYLKML